MSLSFGEKIKEARKAKKFTQKELAEKIGAAHNSISDWENDKNKPDPDTIELLCGILDITPNYLLSNNSSDEFSPSEKLIIKKYRNLDDFGKKTVDFILNGEEERTKQFKELETMLSYQNLESTKKRMYKRVLTYYHKLASAGSGEYLFDDIPTNTIEVPDTPISRMADFVIGVNGDSMKPDYKDGDKVYVMKTDKIEIGEIGIWLDKNQCYMKECGKDRLISRSKEYEDIIPNSDTRLIGKVLGKVEEPDQS